MERELHICLCSGEYHLVLVVQILDTGTDITTSADSRGRLVAGSFQGHSGHIDGKPSDARFKRPTGVAVDDTGNVYVADTANLAIRKIGESGVLQFNVTSVLKAAVTFDLIQTLTSVCNIYVNTYMYSIIIVLCMQI